MQHSEDKTNVQKLIEEYNRQLMDAYRRQTPQPPTPQPKTTAEPPAIDDRWLDEQFPLPDIERDRAAIAVAAVPSQQPQETTPPNETAQTAAPSTDEPQFPYTDEDLNGEVPRAEDTPAAPNIGPSPFVGYLRVFVFTGQRAEPLQGATVTVTRPQSEQDTLYATATTDIDGFTPVLPLPSVNPTLTMRPDIPNPYVPYDIRVSASGFQTTIYENVPIYGNNYVTQSANMLPLIPGQDASVPRIVRSGAPTNL